MVARTVPQELHPNILIVGSLAAAYHHRDRLTGQAVATKDADVVVQPAGAVQECVAIANRLLEAGWQRTDLCHARERPDPLEELRAIRLHPKEIEAFFVELLGLPQASQKSIKLWVPCQLEDGWYGIPCFKFMALLGSDRHDTDVGIQYASPPLMALANLLSHPDLGTERMSGEIEGRKLLRSAKDLGRVLSLAWLEGGDPADWLPIWEQALQTHFGGEARALAASAGNGLQQLLANSVVLEEAHFTTSVGLLRGHNVTVDQLRIIGDRLVLDLVHPLAERFKPV
jgi:hypothetical protein